MATKHASQPNDSKRNAAEARKPPRFWNAYPYSDGDSIEVELCNSRKGLRARELQTLDSLRLKKLGDVSVIRFDRCSTPGMLHRVRHVIVHGTPNTEGGPRRPSRQARAVNRPTGSGRKVTKRAEAFKPEAPTKRKRVLEPRTDEAATRTEEAATVTSRKYDASGGESLLLRVEGDGVMRVERQAEGFALMWPSMLSLTEFLGVFRSQWWEDSGTATYLLAEKEAGGPQEVAIGKDLGLALDEQASEMRFLRLDFKDRTITWSLRYADLTRAGYKDEGGLEDAHEVSLAAESFDRDYVRELLGHTATFTPEQLLDELVDRAEATLLASG